MWGDAAMIAITMRMMRHVYPGGSEEKRDALAQNWWGFLRTALPGISVVPVPNMGGQAVALLQELPIDGLILSGGDDWGVFPERDATEREMFLWADRMSLPILGVCRGAQVINRLMGGKTSSGFEEHHVGTRHAVRVTPWPGSLPCASSLEVNSYHACGIEAAQLAPVLKPWAVAEDGSVEAFTGDNGRLTGIMWHPERETVPQEHDVRLFQHCFRQVRR